MGRGPEDNPKFGSQAFEAQSLLNGGAVPAPLSGALLPESSISAAETGTGEGAELCAAL